MQQEQRGLQAAAAAEEIEAEQRSFLAGSLRSYALLSHSSSSPQPIAKVLNALCCTCCRKWLTLCDSPSLALSLSAFDCWLPDCRLLVSSVAHLVRKAVVHTREHTQAVSLTRTLAGLDYPLALCEKVWASARVAAARVDWYPHLG